MKFLAAIGVVVVVAIGAAILLERDPSVDDRAEPAPRAGGEPSSTREAGAAADGPRAAPETTPAEGDADAPDPLPTYVGELTVEQGNARFNRMVRERAPEAAGEFVAIAGSSEAPDVWRNYAVQHLSIWFERYGEGYHQLRSFADPGNAPAPRSVAVFALARLAGKTLDHPTVPDATIEADARSAMRLALAEEEPAVLVAGIRSSALLESADASTRLAELMIDTGREWSVRVAAADALALIGGDEGARALEACAAELSELPEPHVFKRACARLAAQEARASGAR